MAKSELDQLLKQKDLYGHVFEPFELLVNGINFDQLAEVWKVTKDKRI